MSTSSKLASVRVAECLWAHWATRVALRPGRRLPTMMEIRIMRASYSSRCDADSRGARPVALSRVPRGVVCAIGPAHQRLIAYHFGVPQAEAARQTHGHGSPGG